jgi:hypothetical protein
MRQVALWAGLLLAGFGAGRLTAPRPPPPEPPDDLHACQAQLAVAVDILEAQERERVGVPLAFPEDLPPQYRPEQFEAEIRAALAGCPETGLELAHIECDEFPCMAFFSQPEGTSHHGVDRLRACDSWKTRFASSGQASSRFMTDQGVREYSVVSPSPAMTPDKNANKRWQARLAQGTEELMLAWGGRDAPAP